MKRGKSSTRGTRDVLASLSDAEAASLLRELLSLHPRLRSEAQALARAKFAAVEREDVTRAARDAILGVTLKDIWARARRSGYIEEAEAAWQSFDEAFASFVDEAVRLSQIGETEAARATVEGALIALHAVEREAGANSALSRADGFASEAAANLVERWVAAGGGPLDLDFVHHFLPWWTSFLAPRAAGGG